jgi:hypothetical protein
MPVYDTSAEGSKVSNPFPSVLIASEKNAPDGRRVRGQRIVDLGPDDADGGIVRYEPWFVDVRVADAHGSDRLGRCVQHQGDQLLES